MRVHSNHMSGTSTSAYYWCLRHHRVESGDNVCAERYRLGPFPTPEAATHALERVAERNAEWDAEDARWEGEKT